MPLRRERNGSNHDKETDESSTHTSRLPTGLAPGSYIHCHVADERNCTIRVDVRHRIDQNSPAEEGDADQWLFTKQRIYNEGRAEWAYKGGRNPAW